MARQTIKQAIKGKKYTFNYLARGSWTICYESRELPDKVLLLEQEEIGLRSKDIINSLQCFDNKHISKVKRLRKGRYLATKYRSMTDIRWGNESDNRPEYDIARELYEKLWASDGTGIGDFHHTSMKREHLGQFYDRLGELVDNGTITGELYQAFCIIFDIHYQFADRWCLDFHGGNVASDKDGTLILLDILAPRYYNKPLQKPKNLKEWKAKFPHYKGVAV